MADLLILFSHNHMSPFNDNFSAIPNQSIRVNTL